MAHELVDAEHELLQDAQPRLDGAQLGPEFNVTGHFVFCGLFLFSNTPDYHDYTDYTLFGAKNFGGDQVIFSFF